MIRPINRNPLTLSQKARPATKQDAAIITDLKDTLAAHQNDCVGMAANMISQPVAIIIAAMGPFAVVMVNPVITKQSDAYATKEGCLSLSGQRPCTRFQNICVQYLDEQFQPQTRNFSDFFAEIVQHEMDHLAGNLI